MIASNHERMLDEFYEMMIHPKPEDENADP
jgi:hypothetical protein